MSAASRQTSLDCTPIRRRSGTNSKDRCFACNEVFPTEGVTILDAMGKAWHVECFRCTVCEIPLPDHYYAVEDQPFCMHHFYEATAHKCQACDTYITGPTMTVGMSRMYHPECFTCSSCGIPLGERDPYTLFSTGQLHCCECSVADEEDIHVPPESTEKEGRGGGGGVGVGVGGGGKVEGEGAERNIDHAVPASSGQECYSSIQLIKIPLSKKPVKFRLEGNPPGVKMVGGVPGFQTPQLPRPGQKVAKKNALKIEKLPRSLVASPLRPGDDILEINGVPIVDQDQREINGLMHAYEDCLYLTIERRKSLPMGRKKNTDILQPSISRSSSSTAAFSGSSSAEGKEGKVEHPTAAPIKPKAPFPPVVVPRMNAFTMPRKSTKSRRGYATTNPSQPSNSMGIFSLPSTESLRSWRTMSIPAFDRSADYTQCFRLSDLEIGGIIGQGFYGSVTKVRHRFTGQEMVMKEMAKCTDEIKKSFLKEVQMLKSLNHPNILQFIGILYKEGKVLVLITEYADGGTLRRIIKNLEKPFPWHLRISITRDIAAGMNYLHGLGIIHRDLTSKNVLLRQDLTALVADFGLATMFSPVDKEAANFNGRSARRRMTVVGTPYWMAPEMLRGEVYDEKVDIFSYGIVMCEVITRVKADPDQLPRQKNFGLDVEGIRSMIADCPLPFFHLATECCSLDPDKRPNFTLVEQGLNRLLTVAMSAEPNFKTLDENFYSLLKSGLFQVIGF